MSLRPKALTCVGANGGASAPTGQCIPAQGKALGWPRPPIPAFCRNAASRRLAGAGLIRGVAALLQSAPVRCQPFTQGVALGWDAKPRWGLGTRSQV